MDKNEKIQVADCLDAICMYKTFQKTDDCHYYLCDDCQTITAKYKSDSSIPNCNKCKKSMKNIPRHEYEQLYIKQNEDIIARVIEYIARANDKVCLEEISAQIKTDKNHLNQVMYKLELYGAIEQVMINKDGKHEYFWRFNYNKFNDTLQCAKQFVINTLTENLQSLDNAVFVCKTCGNLYTFDAMLESNSKCNIDNDMLVSLNTTEYYDKIKESITNDLALVNKCKLPVKVLTKK